MLQRIYDLLFQAFCSSEKLFVCPFCGHDLHCHGSVPRTIKLPCGTFTISIRRVRCPHCRHVHRVLPDIFIPYYLFSSEDASMALKKSAAGEPLRLADFSPDTESSSLYRFVQDFRRRFPEFPSSGFRSFFSLVPKFIQRLQYETNGSSDTSVSNGVQWGKTMVFPTFLSSEPVPPSVILSSR